MKVRKQWNDITNCLKMIWQLDRTMVLAAGANAILESSIPYIEIYLSAYVLDQLVNGLMLKPFLQIVLMVLGVILALRILTGYLNTIVHVHTGLCWKKFDMLLGVRTLGMDYELLEAPHVNELRNKISSDNNWGAGIGSVMWQFPAIISFVVQLIYSIIILIPLFVNTHIFGDISALAVLLTFIAVILFYIIYAAKKREEMHKLLDEASTIKNAFSGYYLWNSQSYKQGMDIRIFKGQRVIEKYVNKDLEDETYGRWIWQATKNQCHGGLADGMSAGLLQVIAYLFVAIRAAAGALTVGAVVKYASVIYKFSSALSDFFHGFSELALSAGRIQSTLDYIHIEDVLPKGTIPVEKRAFCEQSDNDYEIELRNVSFKYPGSDKWSLRNVSMKFHIGQRLAIVGMNGSGKSTLIKLLCRLYDPTEGSILLNGVDIRKYDYAEYISLFSVVFQDFKLFAFSLGQNVAASAEYEEEKVIESLKKAGFGERFASLPDGVNTYLYKGFDEQGVEISGGEAQKIALARALYKNAPFIVLDEPTAALDPIAEYDIYNRFNEFVDNKTAIYISHRLSSCRFCNDIAVFHEGQLIQRGSHDALLADSSGKYCEMWNAQAQYYE